MLQDNYGRQFRYLRLSVTEACNYRCNYCLPDGYQQEGRPSFLSLTEIRKIASAFAQAGIDKIRITGGEPSIRKDLPQIIEAVKATPGIKTVALTTNGHRMEKYLDDWVAAGLDRLNVSIDSFDPRMFNSITGHDALESILRALDKACATSIGTIKVNTVLMRQYNLREFEDFLSWIKDRPITLRMIELMETGDNKQFFHDNHVAANELESSLISRGWQRQIRAKSAGPAKEYFHPDFDGRIGFIAPYSKDFCSSCNRLRVSSLGKLHLCLFGEEGYELRPYLDDPEKLIHYIHQVLGLKLPTHYLQEHQSGATKHLAMLGG
ncbi:GTP 3',8-cyclase MoaA [Teredinibacter sp. KSP-S5-2]|uniref:GTP 3',8-cyclase MoaA n=1 Tax=Teredinibacter sp. KSP-S5-2 TaxID=3034506 RepID=UPI002934BE99|nr:GTP 3',8-cyclase MoaA [Teredinibacter sp. KSP-S5-2]WNO11529.1 GTP 3',8-cyclase MoaA [Teredinibacter sp. KSP-S5-2]